MNLEMDDGLVDVDLSVRNLLDLYKQYETFGEAELHRTTPSGIVRVTVTNDEAHYGDRKPGPGTFPGGVAA